MALWVRDWAVEEVSGLIQHSDAGAIASIGTVGDSYDCQSVSAWFRKNRVVLAGTV